MNYKYPLFKVFMPRSVEKPLLETLFSGFIGQGSKVDEFEKNLGEYIGNAKAVTINSATSGIQLALRVAGVEAGDEVITTPMTCTASNMPILANGSKIVWADIDPQTGNIDPEDIKKKITSKTKAILIVHWGGYPCDIESISEIAKENGLKVIEDAAHAMGAEYKDAKIGNFSDFTVYSFQAIKHMTTVDGGVIFCKNEEDYKRLRLLRWYGIDRDSPKTHLRCEENIEEWGYKFHMNDICATIGIEQLKYLEQNIAIHRANAKFYDIALADNQSAKTIKWKNDRVSSFWFYNFHVKDKDRFIEYMESKGIMSSQVHVRNDIHDCFKGSRSKTPLIGVDAFSKSMVSIPTGWWISENARQEIAEAVSRFK
jgi:perosamine synthetase